MPAEFTQYIFLRKELLAVSKVGKFWVREQLCAPYGEAFFCPICAEVWATVTVEGQPTHCRNAFCERHEIGDRLGTWSFGTVERWQLPGSLWSSYDSVWNSRLPPAALQRELLLTIAYREKELNQPIYADNLYPPRLGA